jgi:DNA-binding winged helix-turn-helix (wHTH) protein/tetratricopeptide (TPR) repeat protein
MAMAEARPGTGIELAATAEFELGSVRVRPARRLVSWGSGQSRELEPQVMKVLVALGSEAGEVVSRDRLIEQCWDGRVVGDDSINRCIQSLRRLSRDVEPSAFTIETVSRVGYSLVVTGGSRKPRPATRMDYALPVTRRLAMGGLAAAGAASGLFYLVAGGEAAQDESQGHPANAGAIEWYRKGLEAREQGLFELYPQVQAYFREAVAADPEFSDGWAALALSYAAPVIIETGNKQVALAARARAAAQRTLSLNPKSLEGRTALAFLPSEYGRWAAIQADIRRILDERPSSVYLEWLLRARLAFSLGEVGRSREAVALSRSAVTLKPTHAGSWNSLIYLLWSAGDLEEADAQSERAVARWPASASLWFTRLAILTYSGPAEAALTFAKTVTAPPAIADHELIARRVGTAQALATRAPGDVELATRLHLNRIAVHPGDMMAAARFFAALGHADTVFDIFNGYFFNEGPLAIARPDVGPLTRFEVIDLFLPPMASVWADPRFETLTERTGLARYWTDTGSAPDFRRAAA